MDGGRRGVAGDGRVLQSYSLLQGGHQLLAPCSLGKNLHTWVVGLSHQKMEEIWNLFPLHRTNSTISWNLFKRVGGARLGVRRGVGLLSPLQRGASACQSL